MNREQSTKYFLDTEFIENGPFHSVDLISIGIVSEDGRGYYAVSADFDGADANPWVTENVLPLIKGHPRKRLTTIKGEILDFVGDTKPEFWGYYADYDWVVFCQIFGTMVNLPKGWPMFCRDIKQFAMDRGSPQLPKQDSTEHNALNDAKWNLGAWKFLDSLSVPDTEIQDTESNRYNEAVRRASRNSARRVRIVCTTCQGSGSVTQCIDEHGMQDQFPCPDCGVPDTAAQGTELIQKIEARINKHFPDVGEDDSCCSMHSDVTKLIADWRESVPDTGTPAPTECGLCGHDEDWHKRSPKRHPYGSKRR